MARKTKTFAIGDIHGCAGKLDDLLTRLPLRQGDRIVFLGDYIDRGPDPKAVVDRIIALGERYDVTAIMGNHERMVLDFLREGTDRRLNHWLTNGGGTTIASYGTLGNWEIPADHLLFFEGLRPYTVIDGYLFVHAGIREGARVEDQSESDLLWLREEFYANTRIHYGKGIVFGHTPFGKVMKGDGKYGIDTGAVFGGPLTCISLPELKLYESTC